MSRLLLAALALLGSGGAALANICPTPTQADLPSGAIVITSYPSGGLTGVEFPTPACTVVNGSIPFYLDVASTIDISIVDASLNPVSGLVFSTTVDLIGVGPSASDQLAATSGAGGDEEILGLSLSAGVHQLSVMNSVVAASSANSPYDISVTISFVNAVNVPEPSSLALLGFGLAGLISMRRRSAPRLL